MKIEDFVLEKTEITKSWLQQTLLRSKISVAALAETMGFRSDSSLYKAANPNEPNHRIHLDNLPLLINETGDFFILDQIEALFNRVAFAIPQEIPNLAEVCQEFGKLVKEFGDVPETYGQAIKDGRLDSSEKAQLKKEILELMRQAGAFLKAVEASE